MSNPEDRLGNAIQAAQARQAQEQQTQRDRERGKQEAARWQSEMVTTWTVTHCAVIVQAVLNVGNQAASKGSPLLFMQIPAFTPNRVPRAAFEVRRSGSLNPVGDLVFDLTTDGWMEVSTSFHVRPAPARLEHVTREGIEAIAVDVLEAALSQLGRS